MHAFNGELFVQATWDTSPSRLFRTQFRMVSPKRISNPNNTGDSRNCRAGVQINDSGAALGYYVSEDGYQKWNGTAWVKDTEAEKLFRIREAEETKNSLMQVASEHIAPLQDAADLEIATEEEISLLEAWKKYRVLLNRVDTSTAQDIEWPALP